MGVEGLQRMKVGRYQLGDCLGYGGSTAVYRAATAAGASCAVKVVDRRLQGGEDLAERLWREAAILDRIGHERIIPIRDPMASSEMTAAAMPLMVAPTLQDLMAARTLDGELAWSLLNQIAESLQYVHHWGLTYRLLKPANVLVRANRAYLAEFGITGRRLGPAALASRQLRIRGAQYLAPEQILGEGVDHRADIYAFGVLVFELATGTPLWDDLEASVILQKTLSAPRPSAHERNPAIPPEVDEVLSRALARDPQRRHGSIWNLVQQLAYPPQASRVGTPPRARKGESRSETLTVESLIDVLSNVLSGEDHGRARDRNTAPGPGGIRQQPGFDVGR
jgi:serine/threonine protein kinase